MLHRIEKLKKIKISARLRGMLLNLFFLLVIVLLSLTFNFLLFRMNVIFFSPFAVWTFLLNFIFALVLFLLTNSYSITSIFYFGIKYLPFLTYRYFKRGIIIEDLYNLDELFLGVSLPAKIGIAIFGISIGLMLWRSRFYRFTRLRLFGVLVVLFLIVITVKYPKRISNALYDTPRKLEFNVSASFRFFGVIDSLLYGFLDNAAFSQELSSLTNLKSCNSVVDFRSFVPKKAYSRNVHVVVLESFISPLDLKNVLNIVEPKTSSKWVDLSTHGNSTTGLTAITGGSSAASEFEILCGTPSFFDRFGLAFNRINGKSEVRCLPGYLKQFGYETIAATPVYGSFFNISTVYSALGFSQKLLHESFDTSEKTGGWLDNEAFFRQLLGKLEQKIVGAKPVFTYAFGVGGHSPFEMDTSKFPQKVSTLPDGLQNMTDFVNNILYTAEAVSEYIEQLQKLDPTSMIIVLGDHLPPIPEEDLIEAGYPWLSTGNKEALNLSNYRNRILVLSQEPLILPRTLTFYEIPELIVDHLSGGELCENVNCSIDKPNLFFKGSTYPRGSVELSQPEGSLISAQQSDRRELRAYEEAFQKYLCLIRASRGI